ncbi:MAG: hypothetical protein DCC49_08365 [Acidobacteria bacterium]|nr:MAG: hypothetical protein DCC49_08365 [Acidobacteriota bacterium]
MGLQDLRRDPRDPDALSELQDRAPSPPHRVTEGRPNDWANAQSGPYTVQGGARKQTPDGLTSPNPSQHTPPQPTPYPTPYAPPQPTQYAPPQPTPYPMPYGASGPSYASPYSPAQPSPYGSPYSPAQSSPYGSPYSPAQPSPYGSQYQHPYSPGLPYQQPQAYGYMPLMKRPEAPSANTAMVLGIISLAVGLLLCTPVGLLGIAAVVTGNRAKREIRESRNYLDGQGKVTTALVTGWIAIVIGALGVLLVIAVVSNPEFTSTL